VPFANLSFTFLVQNRAMLRSSAFSDVEADLIALRSAAERAGTAVALLFSTCDELEAAVPVAPRWRKADGASRRTRRILWSALGTLALGLAFVLL
jgi:hypothetical protein